MTHKMLLHMNQGNCKSDFRVVKDGGAGGGEEAGEAAGDRNICLVIF